MTTTQQFAELLDGVEYPVRISKEMLASAKDAGIVIVYGASDDLMEFDGAIRDEIGCYEGGTAYLTSKGLLTNDCDNDNCSYFAREKKSAAEIKAIWCPPTGESWAYETAIPHETFSVIEDGDVYCTGIVFRLADVPVSKG